MSGRFSDLPGLPRRVGTPGIAAALLALCFAWGQAQSDDAYYYRLDAGRLACVIAHKDAYLASGESPVFIPVEQCPPKGATSLLDSLINEAPDLSFSEADALDRFLSISHADLECLAGQSIPAGAQVVRVFPAECRIEAEGVGN